MRQEILMPALSAGMEEGKIARWLKREGDPVALGEVIAEIETDKAVMEMSAQSSGVLDAILAAAGEVVMVNAAIGVLLTEEEVDSPANSGSPRIEGRSLASPLARKMAAGLGVSIRALQGSGPEGRVVRVDVDRAHAALVAGKTAPPLSVPLPDVPKPIPSSAGDSNARLAHAYREVPQSTMRKTIARRMTEAKTTIPHFYLHADCEIDALLQLRNLVNRSHDASRLSINDFIIKAAAVALQMVPEANASWSDDAVRLFTSVDISMAVSTEGGLLTPIVRNADSKSLREISREARLLAQRARQNRLQPAEYQGGGLTVSNLGMYGVQSFSAIINPPQSCILAVGAATRRPVVRGELCVPGTLMSCTLSVDHRCVDGVIGAQYLSAFKALVEEPQRLVADPLPELGKNQ